MASAAEPALPEGLPWKRFPAFLNPRASRFEFLRELLAETGLPCRVVTLAGNRHILVPPPVGWASPEPGEAPGSPPPRPVILVAHYDRTPGSPGANDNSAGVFLLLEAAMGLHSIPGAPPPPGRGGPGWLIIFTDKEELKIGESVRRQGAFALAAGLTRTKFRDARIYSFDACGAGDTLVISTTAEGLLQENRPGNARIRAALQDLRTHALAAARDMGLENDKVRLLPTPFSDDLGFFRAGLAAQTVTMLPGDECRRLEAALKEDPLLAAALVQRGAGSRRLVPSTWRVLNTPEDLPSRLTPQHFPTPIRFAQGLVTAPHAAS